MKKRILAGSSVLVTVLVAWVFLAPLAGCTSVRRDYTAQRRPDGGASLHITGVKHYWMLLTPEGPFPKQRIDCHVALIGPGKDLKNVMNVDGFYYTPNEIKCDYDYSMGYAYMDRPRSFVFLNFSRPSPPDGETALDEINGRYSAEKKGEQDDAEIGNQPFGSRADTTSSAGSRR
jgi:hypothetical protein